MLQALTNGGTSLPQATSSDGLRIEYTRDGDGPPIVLLHGFTAGLARWHDTGYVEALAPDNTLLAIDARAHGGSGKPLDRSAYTVDQMVDDVLAVMDAEGTEQAHLWGYSMGGHQVMQLWRREPDRVLSAIIGAAAAVEREKLGEADPQASALRKGMQAYLDLLDPERTMLSDEARQFQLRHDAEALAELRLAMLDWPEDGPAITVPTLVYAGTSDPVHAAAERYAASLPDATFMDVLDGNHGTAFAISAPILEFVKEFLRA